MSIAPLLRVVVIGRASRRKEALDALQSAGLMHVDGLDEALRRAARTGEATGERARQALRYLAETPRIRAQIGEDAAFEVEAFIEETLANRERRRVLHDRRELLAKRIADVERWGEFVFPRLEDVGQRLWFYETPLRDLKKLRRLDRPWRIVHRASGLAFVVVLSTEEPPEHLAPAPRTHIGGRGLRELLAERDALDLELDELELARETLTRRLTLLARNRAAAEDQGLAALAARLAGEDDALFVLTGWIPADRAGDVETLAADHGVAAVVSPPAPGETPPTLLRPARPVAGGADLLRLYQLPGAREWDPSGVLFFSFCVFFALILSDAGYAAVLLGLSAAAWAPLGKTGAGQRLRGLFAVASAFSLVWGVVVGSYFGAGAPMPMLARLKLISVDDFEAMMALSVGIGAGHVALANLAAAWAARGRLAAISRIGWAVAVVSGFALWRLGGAAWSPAWWTLALGGALVFAGAGGIVRGTLALTQATKLFADVLSYLRLFALGLASASLAVAFNDLADQARESSAEFGLALSVLILIIGHALNLVLAVLGGVVHGLRLNFIEFLGWGLSEEGRPFVPFARRERGAG